MKKSDSWLFWLSSAIVGVILSKLGVSIVVFVIVGVLCIIGMIFI